ncbi:hypothetical protein [Leptospira sp. GIMC2001]|uniref:hypothetical protein n=1 Tax=Leptospira sp. GIMC2001 TaxID=1513297 RepID=UPI00234AB9DA|nr:hypothetical protein [Leptospira sp. GIMC2001]WCL50790.1 hypothetical protein O4O04_08250 [Leptospira sp. GIMC2001]
MKKIKKTDTITLTLQSPPKKILRDGEVTNYLSRLISYHYKLEVINIVKMRLSAGIDPKNIMILGESFKFDHSYQNLKNINILNPKVYSLLNIGIPYSLFPNEEITRLRLGYKLLNKLYDLSRVNTFGFRREWYWKNYKSLLKGNFKNVSTSFLKHKILSKSTSQQKNLANDYVKKIINEFSEKESFFRVKNPNQLSNEKKKSAITDYNRLIKKLHRPVVAEFIPKSKQIIILGLELIKKKGGSNTPFNLLQLTHHNPWSALIQGAGEVFKYFLQAESIRVNNDLQKERLSNEKRLALQNDLKIITDCIATLDKINSSATLPQGYKDSLTELIYMQLEQTSGELKKRASQIGSGSELRVINIQKVDLLV